MHTMYSTVGMQVQQTRQAQPTQSWVSTHGAKLWTGLLTVGTSHCHCTNDPPEAKSSLRLQSLMWATHTP
jgi:hypothetical protein